MLARSFDMRIRNAIAALILSAVFVPAAASAATQHVVLAGGCFWGMQAVFEQLRGVPRVVAGYAGGSEQTAHYDTVSEGTSGHAESVDVTYDPAQISFQAILNVYFTVAHDPTELNRQGPDEGTQYRSEIFYTTAAQRDEARRYIAALSARHTFAAPIVTKVSRLNGFYQAESYHQDFVAHNPLNPYVVVNDAPKLRKLRADFPNLVK